MESEGGNRRQGVRLSRASTLGREREGVSYYLLANFKVGVCACVLGGFPDYFYYRDLYFRAYFRQAAGGEARQGHLRHANYGLQQYFIGYRGGYFFGLLLGYFSILWTCSTGMIRVPYMMGFWFWAGLIFFLIASVVFPVHTLDGFCKGGLGGSFYRVR